MTDRRKEGQPLRNITWYSLSEIGGKGTMMLVLFLYARALGPESFGSFNYVHTLVTLGWVVTNFGTNMYGSRVVAQVEAGDTGEAIAGIIGLRLTAGIVAMAIFLIIYITLPATSIYADLFLIFSLFFVFRALFFDWMLRGLNRFDLIALSNILIFGLLLILSVVFVKNESDLNNAARIWISSYCFGAVIYVSITAWLDKNKVISLSILEMKRGKPFAHLTGAGSYLFAGGLSTIFQVMPVIFVKLSSSVHDLGQFSLAHKFVIAVVYMYTIIPIALYPILCRHFTNDLRRFYLLSSRLLFISFFISLGTSGLVIYFSQFWLTDVFGIAYEGAVLPLTIMSAFVLLRGIREVVYVVLAAAGRQRTYLFLSFPAIGFFGVVFLIWIYFCKTVPASVAASAALVAGEIVFILMSIHFLFKNVWDDAKGDR